MFVSVLICIAVQYCQGFNVIWKFNLFLIVLYSNIKNVYHIFDDDWHVFDYVQLIYSGCVYALAFYADGVVW